VWLNTNMNYINSESTNSVSSWLVVVSSLSLLSYFTLMDSGYRTAPGSGFHPHLPGFRHRFLAKALGATMWFFIFYQVRFVCTLLFHTHFSRTFSQRTRAETNGVCSPIAISWFVDAYHISRAGNTLGMSTSLMIGKADMSIKLSSALQFVIYCLLAHC
jgi:hypothetical protein